MTAQLSFIRELPDENGLPLIKQSLLPEHYQTQDEIEQEFLTSAKTAISRKAPSAPLKQVIRDYPHLIVGSALNYAKGRAQVDSDAIAEIAGHVSDFDYTHCRNLDVLKYNYRFIYCGYATNTLPPMPRQKLWETLAMLCSKERGIAFVASRSSSDRGIKGQPEFDGVRTSLNTFQKGYLVGESLKEALEHFAFAKELTTKGAFRLVCCSHNPIDLVKA
ncbi:hypothetical protein [Photobacterium lutimaris]|uniref:Uncharacterized protein n=1 Tax=Photobacterium lutimaris TaxID=388278 RepID=A0A2T3ITS5_9GAMM|nr:hypothetical protein [Photobacterium lutimaris]PSU31760.1 hypothetical protein C9I99_21490 [Photobacterium lutimaris]TDR72589.1 hypothetical protein DFP78_11365 [Photobacterium lutimaris]